MLLALPWSVLSYLLVSPSVACSRSRPSVPHVHLPMPSGAFGVPVLALGI